MAGKRPFATARNGSISEVHRAAQYLRLSRFIAPANDRSLRLIYQFVIAIATGTVAGVGVTVLIAVNAPPSPIEKRDNEPSLFVTKT